MTNPTKNNPFVDTSVFNGATLQELEGFYPSLINPVKCVLENNVWRHKLLDPHKLEGLQFCIRENKLMKLLCFKQQFDQLFKTGGYSNGVIALPPIAHDDGTYNAEAIQLGFKSPQKVVFNIGVMMAGLGTSPCHDEDTWEPCKPHLDFPVQLNDCTVYRNRYNHATFFIWAANIGVAAGITLQLMSYNLDNCTITHNQKGDSL